MKTGNGNAMTKGYPVRGSLGAMLMAGALLWAGPGLAQEAPFPATLDEAYTGNLTAELFPLDGGSRIHRDWGSAEVIFSQMPDGTVRFSAKGEIDDDEIFEVSVELREAEDGLWRSLSPEGMVQLGSDGRLLSISLIDGFELVWSGAFTPEEGQLTFRQIPTPEAPEDQDDITAIFTLDVERPRPEPEPDPTPSGGEASQGSGDCERIEWRLVNRWTWGGGLSLSREPFCVH